jgi:hypothetical protein
MSQTKVVETNKTHILLSDSPTTQPLKMFAVYDVIWKNILEQSRLQMTVRRTRIAFWIPKAPNTHSRYVTLIVLPLQL